MATVEFEIEIESPTEDERVVEWRAERLQLAGFDDVGALELALRRDIDLHRAVGLLGDGCEPALALEILL